MSELLPLNAPRSTLLDVDDMVSFACNGFIRLDAVVPEQINEQILAELEAFKGDGFRFWFESPAMRSIFGIPKVMGAIESLVGPNPIYNHSFVHIVPARHKKSQDWHADSVINTRASAFDVLLMYFPARTPNEMGPTLVLPGSHLRRIRFGSIALYRNILGQQRLACDAGTIVIVHADIWHCAQPNSTDRTRYMFKVRLEPSVEQRKLFKTDGYDSPKVLDRIFKANQPWLGHEHREDQIQRAKFWRYLTGDDRVDAAHGQLTRLGL
jgi:hypothetical protein